MVFPSYFYSCISRRHSDSVRQEKTLASSKLNWKFELIFKSMASTAAKDAFKVKVPRDRFKYPLELLDKKSAEVYPRTRHIEKRQKPLECPLSPGDIQIPADIVSEIQTKLDTLTDGPSTPIDECLSWYIQSYPSTCLLCITTCSCDRLPKANIGDGAVERNFEFMHGILFFLSFFGFFKIRSMHFTKYSNGRRWDFTCVQGSG